MNKTFEGCSVCISDNKGDLRDMSEILSEMKDVRDSFSTHAMSDYVLFLKGKLEMLNEVIEYLEHV